MEAQHLSDMWSLVAGADAHFESVARLNSADPALSQHTSVEEGIARSIRECDEPEAFLGTEPLHDCADWSTARYLEPGLAEPGWGAERTRLWVSASKSRRRE
jgi:hypothetical protein